MYVYKHIIKKLLRTSKLITSTITSSRFKTTRKEHGKKIMQIANVNTRFTTFPTMIKHETLIDKWAKISENFLRSLVKSLKLKFLHQNAIVRNEKPQRAEKRYLRPTIMRIILVFRIQNQSPGGVLSKSCP